MALDFIAGCIGGNIVTMSSKQRISETPNRVFLIGCAGVIVGHPLDTVKVCLQTQDAKNPRYKNTFHCLQSIFAKEGVRGIYKGVTSPLMGKCVKVLFI